MVFAVFVLITILFLTGHGANLIAGYNTTSPQKREKYNEKKLCWVVGMGMLVITLLILIMAIIKIVPSLNFGGNCRDAFQMYEKASGGQISYGEADDL